MFKLSLFPSFLSGLKCHDSLFRGLFRSSKTGPTAGAGVKGDRLHQIDLIGEGFPNIIEVTGYD